MDYIVGILIYLFLLFAVWFYSKTLKPYETGKLCLFSAILLSLFTGLSYDIGWDYLNYRTHIINGDIERFEFLERELMRLSKNIPQLFFIINHTAIISLTIWTINRYSPNKLLSIFVFICFPYQFLFGLSTIRAALMVAIIFAGYMYFLYEQNKPHWFILTVFIAFFIHQAALAGIILLGLHYLKLGRWANLVITILSFTLSASTMNLNINFLNGISLFDGISERFEYYKTVELSGGSVIHYCFFALSLIGIVFYDKIKQHDIAKVSLSMVTVGFFLAMLFQQAPVLSSRLSRFFYIFSILLIPYFINIVPKGLKGKTINLLYLTLLILLLYQLSIDNYNGMDYDRSSTYWPYKTFLNTGL